MDTFMILWHFDRKLEKRGSVLSQTYLEIGFRIEKNTITERTSDNLLVDERLNV
jgi:hypothetical protein